MTVLSYETLFGPPRGPRPAPSGSQQVPPPPYLRELPHYMLYGFELDPALFGPGDIDIRRADGKVVTYPRPRTADDAVNMFRAKALELDAGVRIEPTYGPEGSYRIASFAVAKKDEAIFSNLNRGEAIPSVETFETLKEQLHLVREPRWIDTTMWETPVSG
ncbi:hypothetical protein B0H15DRAFT_814454 [Mycena belliarum]|uniref:Uncharacterized protein n=1 Tax=Mycena belliarum TaxID=1033014 RepID=A0AAD6UIE5_9AGAR|nr:hypothetical protein B0H15DRAFT_814454 [Mycena belliae]